MSDVLTLGDRETIARALRTEPDDLLALLEDA